jgi:hypothetical protein
MDVNIINLDINWDKFNFDNLQIDFVGKTIINSKHIKNKINFYLFLAHFSLKFVISMSISTIGSMLTNPFELPICTN